MNKQQEWGEEIYCQAEQVMRGIKQASAEGA